MTVIMIDKFNNFSLSRIILKGHFNVDLVKYFLVFMEEDEKFWLAPIFIVVPLMGVLIVLTHGSAVAPFIYSLFYS